MILIIWINEIVYNNLFNVTLPYKLWISRLGSIFREEKSTAKIVIFPLFTWRNCSETSSVLPKFVTMRSIHTFNIFWNTCFVKYFYVRFCCFWCSVIKNTHCLFKYIGAHFMQNWIKEKYHCWMGYIIYVTNNYNSYWLSL